MLTQPPTPLASRATRMISGLLQVIRAYGGHTMPLQPLLWLAFNRISRFKLRIRILSRRLADGLSVASRRGTPKPKNPEPQPEPGPRERPPSLPGGGTPWLRRLFDDPAAPCVADLLALANDPEMQALMAAAPQIKREFRGILRLLISPQDFPPCLAPPAPPPRPRSASPPRQRKRHKRRRHRNGFLTPGGIEVTYSPGPIRPSGKPRPFSKSRYCL